MLRTEAISKDTLALLTEIMSYPVYNDFRLVGGTALALYYGHRLSEDLDFFTDKETDFNQLQWHMVTYYGNYIQDCRPGAMGIFAVINNIKVDFMNWGHPFRYDVLDKDAIRMAHPLEIAAMKIEAISSRAVKKDFIDFAVLLDHFSFSEIIENYKLTFPWYDYAYAIKQLTNFAPAEDKFMPDMLIPLTWQQAKEKITAAVKQYWEDALKG